MIKNKQMKNTEGLGGTDFMEVDWDFEMSVMQTW